MATLTRTLQYQTEHEYGDGWTVQEMPGFSPISTESPQWSRTLTHDLIEHDPDYAPGTLANELGAIGAIYSNRHCYEGTVDLKNITADLENVLENLDHEMTDCEGDYSAMLEILDREIPLVDHPMPEDELISFVTDFLNAYSCEWFTAGDRIWQILQGRIVGHMENGAIAFNEKFDGANYGGVFSYIQGGIEKKFSTVDSVLTELDMEDLHGYISEFWDGFAVTVTIDTQNLNVSLVGCWGTLGELEEIRSQCEDDDQENEDQGNDDD